MGEEGGEQQLAWAAGSMLPVGEGWSELRGAWGTLQTSLTMVAHFVPGCLLLQPPHRPVALPPHPLPPGTVGPQSPCVLNHRNKWVAGSLPQLIMLYFGTAPFAHFFSSVPGHLEAGRGQGPGDGVLREGQALFMVFEY